MTGNIKMCLITGWMSRHEFLAGAEIFFFSTASQAISEVHPASFPVHIEGVFALDKAAGA